MTMRREFDVWFEATYGPEPREVSAALEAAQVALHVAQRRHAARTRWLEARGVAMRAWGAACTHPRGRRARSK